MLMRALLDAPMEGRISHALQLLVVGLVLGRVGSWACSFAAIRDSVAHSSLAAFGTKGC